MCALCLTFNEILPWCLVVPEVFRWSQNFPPLLHALKYLGCVLKARACSTWFVYAIWVFTIGALGTYCQSHLETRQNNSSMSWYSSPSHFFCAFQVVPIDSLSVFFCQSFLMLPRNNCISSGFWVVTLFMFGNCLAWSRFSEFIVHSDYWGDLLILRYHHSNTGGRRTYFTWFK